MIPLNARGQTLNMYFMFETLHKIEIRSRLSLGAQSSKFPLHKINGFSVYPDQRIIPKTLCFIMLLGENVTDIIYLKPNQQYFH